MTHEPDEGWRESPSSPKMSIDESVEMLRELSTTPPPKRKRPMSNTYPEDCGQWRKERTKLRAEVTDLRVALRSEAATVVSLGRHVDHLTLERDRLLGVCKTHERCLEAAKDHCERLRGERDNAMTYMRGTLGFIPGVSLLQMAKDLTKAYHYDRSRIQGLEAECETLRGDKDHLATELADALAEKYQARAALRECREDIAVRVALHRLSRAAEHGDPSNVCDCPEYIRALGAPETPGPLQLNVGAPTGEPYLECPSCGDVAASGMVSDGDPLECGCPGAVSHDGESDPSIIEGETATEGG